MTFEGPSVSHQVISVLVSEINATRIAGIAKGKKSCTAHRSVQASIYSELRTSCQFSQPSWLSTGKHTHEDAKGDEARNLTNRKVRHYDGSLFEIALS